MQTIYGGEDLKVPRRPKLLALVLWGVICLATGRKAPTVALLNGASTYSLPLSQFSTVKVRVLLTLPWPVGTEAQDARDRVCAWRGRPKGAEET